MGETESKAANGAVHATTTTSDSSTVAAGQDDQPPIAEPPDLAIEKPRSPHTLSAQAVALDLKSDVDDGLSSEEAAARLARDGPNSIKGAKGISLYEIFIQQIANALTVVLIAVTALSFAISDYVEGGVVAAVIVLNIVVGYVFAAAPAQPICCCLAAAAAATPYIAVAYCYAPFLCPVYLSLCCHTVKPVILPCVRPEAPSTEAES